MIMKTRIQEDLYKRRINQNRFPAHSIVNYLQIKRVIFILIEKTKIILQLLFKNYIIFLIINLF